ncbi:MAG: hypothetical protein GTO18_12855 [Anaerolineales bacterium]|nr:hypothetical protein [Anaerolineales bacterium]
MGKVLACAHKQIIYILLFGSVILLQACGTEVISNHGDTTPPQVELRPLYFGEELVLRPEDKPIARPVFANQMVTLLGIASDEDGGVQSINIEGEAGADCTRGDLSSSRTFSYYEVNTSDPASGEEALSVLSVALNVDVRNLRELCPEGYELRGVGGWFVARARNFAGMEQITSAFNFSLLTPILYSDPIFTPDSSSTQLTIDISDEGILTSTPPPLPSLTASITPLPPTPSFTNQPPSLPTLTPKPSIPAAPSKLAVVNRVCEGQEYSVTLGWIDNANNEQGYRVYRGKELIATLKPNATGYNDKPPGSGPYTFGVEAYNAAGKSGRPTVYEEGCLY